MKITDDKGKSVDALSVKNNIFYCIVLQASPEPPSVIFGFVLPSIIIV